MPSIHLPTELLIQIFFYISSSNCPERQKTLHSCTLVSRQWYSASISFLYERPHVGTGESFNRFTSTVCPPVSAPRKGKYNLGGFVRKLDLSGLVHHSSNSLTARLLGRVRENLEVFVAPRVSFASNSLPALSKSHNLRSLDLSLTSDPIPFPQLKKTLQNHKHLKTLRLPRSSFLSPSPSSDSTPWPPSLQKLQISGTFSPSTIATFIWPPSLTNLTLNECTDLSVQNLSSLLSSPQLGNLPKLSLSISAYNRNLTPESMNSVPAFLPRLRALRVPGDLVEDMFFEVLCGMVEEPVGLEVLELEAPREGAGSGRRVGVAVVGFETGSLVRALFGGLRNLKAVGFAEVFITESRICEDKQIDEVLGERGGDGVYYILPR